MVNWIEKLEVLTGLATPPQVIKLASEIKNFTPISEKRPTLVRVPSKACRPCNRRQAFDVIHKHFL